CRIASFDTFAPFEAIMKPALSTAEAARRLGISKSTLIRAVNRGDIQPAFRTPGRQLRVTDRELKEIKQRLTASGGGGGAQGKLRRRAAPFRCVRSAGWASC